MNENYMYQSSEALTGGDIVITLISYLVSALVFFALGRKANNGNAWFAFVPILNYVLYFQLIGRSGWNILWYFAGFVALIPVMAGSETLGLILMVLWAIVILILSIVWAVELFRVFGMSGWWVLTIFVPFVGSIIFLILYLYMAFSNKVQYVGRQ